MMDILALRELSNQLKRVNSSMRFVKIIDLDEVYHTHGRADFYGVINYDLGISPKKNRIYIITKDVFINNNDDGFAIELYNKGYLISDQGCKKASYSEFLHQTLADFKDILNFK
jgi:hypothetical protein